MQYGRPMRAIAPAALDQLSEHAWPGNVRALRHACERAVILGTDAEYGFADFGLGAGAAPALAPAARPPEAGEDFKLGARERDTIAAALEQAKGNISQAARLLGVSRAALYRKLGKHGI